MIHEYSKLGKNMSSSWGFSRENEPVNDVIKSLTESQKLICLMAAVVEEVKSLRSAIRELKPPKELKDDSPSSGMLEALRVAMGDVDIRKAMSSEKLSVRARRAIYRLEIKHVSEITRERLAGIRQCGEKTICELLDFRSKFMPI